MLSEKNGIYYYFGYDNITVSRRMRLIKKTGFDAVSIWGLPNKDEQPEITAAEAQKQGLELEFIHIPFEMSGYIFEDDEKGQTAFEHIEMNIQLASKVKCPCVVAHISSWHHPKEITKTGIERLKTLCGLGEKLNVKLAVENINNSMAVYGALEAIDSPYLGFCFDSGHELCFTHNEIYLPALSDRLMAVHLHDNDTAWDKHALPGAGSADWERIIKEIKASPYNASLMLEVNAKNSKQYKKLHPEEFLQMALDSLKSIRSLDK